MAEWLQRDLIPRYGKPKWIRCDAGREFMKNFTKLCGDLGVVVRVASSGYPRLNGQEERVNREINKAVRKYATPHPTSTWWDWLSEVLAGLRMLAKRAHGYSPFYVVFKQSPIIPGRPLEIEGKFPLSWDSSPKEEASLTDELVELFWEVKARISQRLEEADQRMKTAHDKGQDLFVPDFVPGDKVVV